MRKYFKMEYEGVLQLNLIRLEVIVIVGDTKMYR